MTRLQGAIIRYILKGIVRQGGHAERIIAWHRLLIQAAEREFSEDNRATLTDFLRECHEQALQEWV